jgi:succinate dehydrogenase/fumarate reductase flavoprotein subunit
MLLVSEMVCRAALMRQESRGSHFRKDYPHENNDEWLQNINIIRHGEEMRLTPQPVEPYRE